MVFENATEKALPFPSLSIEIIGLSLKNIPILPTILGSLPLFSAFLKVLRATYISLLVFYHLNNQ